MEEENKENNEVAENKEEVVIDNQEEALKRELNELDDRYKRLLAEFENYKKRSSKERENMYNMITGDVLLNMLPVIDNLEKAVDANCEDKNYQDGIVMIYKQYQATMEKFGLKAIESLGQRFDPELHEAVSHVDDSSKGEQEIVEEYRKGYQIGSKVIRHALVVVAN